MSFAIHGSNLNDNAVKSYKSPFKKVATRFYAAEGAIFVHDQETGEEFQIALRDWLERALAFNAMARQPTRYHDEREALTRLVEKMVAVAQEAKRQGDPYRPGVLAERAGARSRPVSMAVTGAAGRGTAAIPSAATGQVDPGSLVRMAELGPPDWARGRRSLNGAAMAELLGVRDYTSLAAR